MTTSCSPCPWVPGQRVIQLEHEVRNDGLPGPAPGNPREPSHSGVSSYHNALVVEANLANMYRFKEPTEYLVIPSPPLHKVTVSHISVQTGNTNSCNNKQSLYLVSKTGQGSQLALGHYPPIGLGNREPKDANWPPPVLRLLPVILEESESVMYVRTLLKAQRSSRCTLQKPSKYVQGAYLHTVQSHISVYLSVRATHLDIYKRGPFKTIFFH